MINYKKGKLGCLPGEILGLKIWMLENPSLDFGKHQISSEATRSFRNVHYKRTNRRFRKGNNITDFQD